MAWAHGGCAQDAGDGPAAAAASSDPPKSASALEVAPPAARTDWTAAGELKERIEGEIAELEALVEVQTALLQWNRARAEAGLAPVSLSPDVCVGAALAAWCRLLPGTFGAALAATPGGQGDDGR